MRVQAGFRFLRTVPFPLCSATTTALFILVLTASAGQERAHPLGTLGMEITSPGDPTPLARIRIENHGFASIPRQRLRINDPSAAGEFVGVNIMVNREGDDITARIALMYVDMDQKETGMRTSKEKIIASYTVRKDEPVRVVELERLGIEPFEMKVMDAKPIALKPGEGPRITNLPMLEVERIEKHFDAYRIWLRNKSDKNIVTYTVSTGRRGTQRGRGAHGRTGPALAAGATSEELYIQGDEAERAGIKISVAVFDDGTFEGEPKLAIEYLANEEGVRVQSPSVLRMIEQTLKVDDSDLRAAFDKLEADLWIIPEALYKAPALQFLKDKFPNQDDKALSSLYEVFKGGLYDSRNIALAALGNTGRSVKDLEERGQFASAVELIRLTLERLRGTFVQITTAKQ